jgi:hypothetical protein
MPQLGSLLNGVEWYSNDSGKGEVMNDQYKNAR